MAEGIKGLQRTYLVILMTLGTAHLLACGQCFRMGCGQAGDGPHLGTGGEYHYQPGYRQGGK